MYPERGDQLHQNHPGKMSAYTNSGHWYRGGASNLSTAGPGLKTSQLNVIVSRANITAYDAVKLVLR